MTLRRKSVSFPEKVARCARKHDRALKLFKEAEQLFDEILPKMLKNPQKVVSGYRLKHNFSEKNTIWRAKPVSEYELEKAVE